MKVLFLRYLMVGAGGFIGTIARFTIGLVFGRMSLRFPFGTLIINVAGSFFLGWFLTYFASRQISETTKMAISIGFVGGFTTFSTFMFESNTLLGEKANYMAFAYLGGSLILGLAAVYLGTILGRAH